MNKGGFYITIEPNDTGLVEPKVWRMDGPELLDRHAAAVVCYFVVAHIKSKLPNGAPADERTRILKELCRGIVAA